eukprot:6478628-Alexandrium_andersonii.AAC.1
MLPKPRSRRHLDGQLQVFDFASSPRFGISANGNARVRLLGNNGGICAQSCPTLSGCFPTVVFGCCL